MDLHVGQETRKHNDIDVVIFRNQQQVLYEFLKQDWMLYQAQNGTLQPWKNGESLNKQFPEGHGWLEYL
ncbi:hypothetical protein JCM9157_4063 [Halalkalibacter akibai JCM 9157]|uniref:Uncharacterized protein n=1 Tax=Halalkalibacter akibai (strain ATCC 43226 / DSM 21942 / CIP 109018 / JCM 9157 / 1139) TaxID=1236973 RepID=W4QY55_HALA3|nr:hypothetical protein JCM9157_4063 [Halalkalibacter akibai JCM 9157]